MDIGGIAIQPASDSLLVAYRPIYFQVYANALVGPEQPMYADVYLAIDGSGIFYKTFTSFSTFNVGGTNSVFEFDIQDAFQEFLSTYIPTVTLPNIIPAVDAAGFQFSMGAIEAQVYFRGSTYSGDVLIPNPVVPRQGTTTTPAIPGSGTPSNAFIVLNGTLPPNYINDIYGGLNSPETILQALVPFTPPLSDQRVYGLSNLPLNPNPGVGIVKYNICPEVYASDHGGFPLLILQFGSYSVLDLYSRLCELYLDYWSEGDVIISETLMVPSQLLTRGLWYLPCGLKEIAAFLPGIIPTLLNPNNNMYYRLRLFDVDSGYTCFYSPVYKVRNKGVENKRLWFQNYWGHFEQLSFVRNAEQFKVVSSEQFRPYLQSTDSPHSQSDLQYTGRQRFNVRTQEETTLVGVFPEPLLPWIKELLGSPFVFMDVDNWTAFPLAPVQLRGFKVQDDTFTIRKSVIEGRINYMVSVKLPPTLDTISLRN